MAARQYKSKAWAALLHDLCEHDAPSDSCAAAVDAYLKRDLAIAHTQLSGTGSDEGGGCGQCLKYKQKIICFV